MEAPPAVASRGGRGREVHSGPGVADSRKRSVPDGPEPTEQDLDQFVQVWGLDAQCTALLREQAPDVQRHVIDRFKPKVDTKDIASLFKGFIKSFMFGPGHSKRARGPP